MSTSPEVRAAERPDTSSLTTARLLAEPALLDWFVLAAVGLVWLLVLQGKPGSAREHFLLYLGALWVGYLAVVVAYRAFAPGGAVLQRLYRTAPLVTACAVYFRLRDLFPIVNPVEYDAQLHALDRAIFGTDLSLAVEPYLTRGIVDWFAFWYWLYFPMIFGGIFVAIYLSTTPERRARFATATILTFLLGHLVYIAVPGLGPWHHLADQYQAPLDGGWFFQASWNTYRRGAGHDIFPSLHTAVSLCYAIFLVRERKESRLARWAMPAVLFIAVNVIIATIVLRWHYFVDLIAGAALAALADFVARRLLPRYEAWRARLGVTPQHW